MSRRTRHRLRIAFLAIFCLLFQQAALASYLCPMEQMPAETTAMSDHCAEMGMQPAQDNPALCLKHCAPDHSTSPDQAKLTVPALAMPSLLFYPALVQPIADRTMEDVPIARSDPPPRLRFCTLLI